MAASPPVTTSPVLMPTPKASRMPRSSSNSAARFVEALLQLGDATKCPNRVVLVQERQPEDRRDCLARHRLDRAAMTLDGRLNLTEGTARDVPRGLWVEASPLLDAVVSATQTAVTVFRTSRAAAVG